jgi:hypothetical protein
MPWKKVTLIIYTDKTVTATFSHHAGSGMPDLPVVPRELNQLHSALRLGFRKQIHKYRRDHKSPVVKEQEPINEPA